jgi:hypothetical protein
MAENARPDPRMIDISATHLYDFGLPFSDLR